jgi:serine/threonine-protein kinase HipA
MNRCPITYELCGQSLYSESGLKLLSPALKILEPLGLTADELRAEAMQRASRMSIQGTQPKLSAILNIKGGRFEIVDTNGRFIIKPQHHIFPELPQNEDLTMKLAASIGIEVPVHGLLWTKDGSLSYVIKRFDRKGQKGRVAVEDFAQLARMTRDTKYNYSMEKLVRLMDTYCTFPAVEKAKLFKITVFNFLVGNEDMHLKNYSIITRNGKVELSPAYDLLNSTIVLRGDVEEIALSLKGKKKNLDRNMVINYFGSERCNLTKKTMERTIETINSALSSFFSLVEASFLSDAMKEMYKSLLKKRMNILGLG